MIAFEEVFFGHRKLDGPAFETCWSRLEEFEKQVGMGWLLPSPFGRGAGGEGNVSWGVSSIDTPIPDHGLPSP